MVAGHQGGGNKSGMNGAGCNLSLTAQVGRCVIGHAPSCNQLKPALGQIQTFAEPRLDVRSPPKRTSAAYSTRDRARPLARLRSGEAQPIRPPIVEKDERKAQADDPTRTLLGIAKLRTSHVDRRSRRYAARQYVSETHSHKPDAPPRKPKEEMKPPLPKDDKEPPA